MEDEKVYAYTLNGPSVDKVRTIYEQLNVENEIASIKKAIDNAHAEITQKTVDYMKDEFVLRFEEAAMEQARRMVAALLKGDVSIARSFGLVRWGENSALDVDGVRAAIVEQFKDQITDAEMVGLRAENDHLKQVLEARRTW